MSAIAAAPKPGIVDRARACYAQLWSVAGPVDPIAAAIVVSLVAFGNVMVYSASAVEATVQHHDAQYFLKRQVIYGVIGLSLTWLISRIDYHRLRKLTYPILAVSVALLAVCAAGFGKKAGGAMRWIAIGPIHIQPAEVSKLALVIWLAYSLAKKGDRLKTFSVGFLPHVIMSGLLVLLCLKQTDFGSSVVLLLLTFTMLFVAGARVGYILGAGILGALGGVALVRGKEYRMARIVAWLEMEANRTGLAY
ncbi:MAG: FtsW/RodA/SpoVE family cell cycle protein, partial [Polyangiales bacterium]